MDKLIICDAGKDITQRPLYCGNGSLMEWKEKLGKRIKQNQKYLITAISNQGPYGMSWFSTESLFVKAKDFDEFSLCGGHSDNIQRSGFELTKQTRKILEEILKE